MLFTGSKLAPSKPFSPALQREALEGLVQRLGHPFPMRFRLRRRRMMAVVVITRKGPEGQQLHGREVQKPGRFAVKKKLRQGKISASIFFHSLAWDWSTTSKRFGSLEGHSDTK